VGNLKWLLIILAACQSVTNEPLDQLALDRPFFDCRVQPVLAKSCSALACHGDDRRFFRVFARNRGRLDNQETMRNAFMTTEERDHNYAAALAVIDASDPDHSPLLMKPLDEAVGGRFHVGATKFGKGDVFATSDDPDYQVLAAWIAGATEQDTCVEPGSDL
jgi:hypothetical protein